MHVEAVDVSGPRRVVILGRAVLAEADDRFVISGKQHAAAVSDLATHDRPPVAERVRRQLLPVPGLAGVIAICRLPCEEMQVAQRRRVARLCMRDFHAESVSYVGKPTAVFDRRDAFRG